MKRKSIRFGSFLLVMSLLIAMFPAPTSGEVAAAPGPRSFINRRALIDKNQEGETEISFVTSQAPHYFTVLDAETGVIKFSEAVPDNVTEVYQPERGFDGNIYFAGSDDGSLLRYLPAESRIEHLGINPTSNRFVWDLTSTSDGKIYGGTYPNSKVFVYDIPTGEFTDLGPVHDGAAYARSVTATDDFLYIGTGGTSYLYRMDLEKPGEFELIPAPFNGEAGHINAIQHIGDQMFVKHTKGSYVFDTATMNHVSTFSNRQLLLPGPAPHAPNLIYSAVGTTGLQTFNTETLAVELIEDVTVPSSGQSQVAAEWMTLSDGRDILAGFLADGVLWHFDPDTEILTEIEVKQEDPDSGDFVPPTWPTLVPDALDRLTASEPQMLSQPITDALQIEGNDFMQNEEGDTIVFATTNGKPALFFVYNIDKDELLAEYRLTHIDEDGIEYLGGISNSVSVGPDGYVYIITRTNGLFFRYNPETDEMRSYGRFSTNIDGEQVIQTSWMDVGHFDEAGNYYWGTYPDAALFKYDAELDEIVDLGNHVVIGDYVRSLAAYKNTLFIGGLGVQGAVKPGVRTASAVLYDTVEDEFIDIPNPSLEGVFEAHEVETYYAVSVSGQWVFARSNIGGSVGAYYLNVFDMESREWVDHIPYSLHLHVTPMVDTDGDGIEDTIYFHDLATRYGMGGSGTALISYDPLTKERQPVSDTRYDFLYMRNPSVLQMKDQEKYPGDTIVASFDGNSGIGLLNLTTLEIEYLGDKLPRAATTMRGLQANDGDEILVSAYMGEHAYVYSISEDKTIASYPSRQIEGLNYFDGKFYAGMYGRGADLTEIDITMPADSSNPRDLGTLGVNIQDRAFVVENTGETILWGSVPNYGRLGGAFGIYDKATGTYDVYQEPVPQQSIGGLAYKDGKIYGSTHIYGGLGIAPIDAPAKLFVFDVATKQVEKIVDVQLSTDSNTQYYAGKMTFSANGDLLVATAQTLLVVDPDDLSIRHEVPIGRKSLSLSNSLYIPFSLWWADNGLLYTNIGDQFSAVDPETYEVKTLSKDSANVATLASDGNIYYASSDYTAIMVLPLTLNDTEEPSFAGQMSITADKETVLKEDEELVTVTVAGHGLDQVNAYNLVVDYDDTMLELDVIRAVDTEQIFYVDVSKSTVGAARIIMAGLPLSGEAELFELTFKVIGSGTAEVSITKADVARTIDGTSEEATSEILGDPISILVQTLDLNGDGQISLADLSKLAVYYRVTVDANPEVRLYDFNQDGIIDALDLAILTSAIE